MLKFSLVLIFACMAVSCGGSGEPDDEPGCEEWIMNVYDSGCEVYADKPGMGTNGDGTYSDTEAVNKLCPRSTSCCSSKFTSLIECLGRITASFCNRCDELETALYDCINDSCPDEQYYNIYAQ